MPIMNMLPSSEIYNMLQKVWEFNSPRQRMTWKIIKLVGLKFWVIVSPFGDNVDCGCCGQWILSHHHPLPIESQV